MLLLFRQDQMDKEVWMAEMSKDAEMRANDRKVRRERADTLNTQAIKAFRREEYDRALSCYNRAIELIKDNPMFYCDRALTNIKLGNYEKVKSNLNYFIQGLHQRALLQMRRKQIKTLNVKP